LVFFCLTARNPAFLREHLRKGKDFAIYKFPLKLRVYIFPISKYNTLHLSLISQKLSRRRRH